MDLEILVVKIEKPQDTNFILGQSHFIKTVEDLHEAIVETVPGMEFGIAFCESSGFRKIRASGNNDALVQLAKNNAKAIGCGHSFIIFMEKGYPINILNKIQSVSEIVNIFCATANPVDVIIAQTNTGRGILGVIDGAPPTGFEDEEDVKFRKDFLRKLGYKL